MQAESQGYVRGALNAVDANFSVTLRGVSVTGGKKRAGIQYGQVQVDPLYRSRTSMLPPKIPGGRVRNSPSSAERHPSRRKTGAAARLPARATG